MKITVFSSNQVRHTSLANSLAKIAEEVFYIKECNTIFPGKLKAFFNNSKTMQKYFKNVIKAEKKIFGNISFTNKNVRTLSMRWNDLNNINFSLLKEAFKSDIYIVFGSSYIKGSLVDKLIENKAINIHMGISPYYRGSSCNFWALYDANPGYVGATIHYLSKGLDSGRMLYHCIPKYQDNDSLFDFSMRAVKVAHDSLVERIKTKEIHSIKAVKQKKELEIRYTKNIDFTDEVAKEFLKKERSFSLKNINYPKLLNPYSSF